MASTQSAFDQIKQGVGSFLGNLDKEFQNYTQPARNLANNGGLIGQIAQRVQTLPQQFQAIQQSIPAPQVNSRPYNLLQHLADFQQKLPTPQRVTQDVSNFIKPVVDYGQNLAGFAGLGPATPESTKRQLAFNQKYPKYSINSPESQQQMMDMALSFSPMGYTKVAEATGARILAKKFPAQTLKTAINDLVDKAFSTAKDTEGTVNILGGIMNKVTEGNPTIQALKALRAKLSKKMVEVSGAPGNWWKSDYAHIQKMKQDSVVGPILDTIQTHITALDDMIKNKGNINIATPTVPIGKVSITPPVSIPQRVIVQLPRELQGAKPRYGYGTNNFQLKFQSDIDKSLYVVAQSKPSARDADYLKYLQGIFPELSVSEIRQMGQKLRNTIIKPLAAEGEGDVLNIPSFSDTILQTTSKIEPPAINPNPTTTTAWEQSLVDTGITKPVIPEVPVTPPTSHLQTADEFAANEAKLAALSKGKVPNMQFEPGVIPETPPSLQEDIAKIQAGNKGGVVDSIKQAFADWVNARRASRVEGYIKSKDFQELDSEGLNGIFKFQAGENQGLYGKVKEFFDVKYSELQKAGLTFNYKSDYLPQLWSNTPEEVTKVFGRRLGLKPSFAFKSIIKDYETGIAAGLTPRFNTISELAGWYEGRANRALADLGFFKSLGSEGTILPKSKAPFGWVTLDPDRFPKFQVTKGDKVYSGTFSAPKPIADMINNYLRDPQFGALNNIANFVSAAKNRALSFGIPFTSINMHGINILARHTLFGTGGNPISRLLTGVKYLFNYNAAQNYLDKILETAPKAMKQGLTVGVEDFQGLFNNVETTGTFGKLGKTWNTMFEKPLFDKMIPALKLSSWQNLTEDFSKKMSHDAAGKEAAKIVNNVYGGINWEAMGRNRDLQNLYRSVILAPDWAESTLRLGGNLAKAFTTNGPVAMRYKTMVTTLVGSYVAANIANQLSSGHMMYENDPGHTMEIEVGYTSDGQKRYFRPYGTAADFVRLPYDTILALAKGDPTPIVRTFTNRLSVPLAALGHIIFNVDYRGNPIAGKTKYGDQMPFVQSAANLGGEAISGLGFPAFAKQALQTGTGQQGLEQGVLQGFELPFRYSGGAYSKSQKTAKGIGQAGGASGEDLYKINEAMRGVTLSKNQEALLQQEGIKILPDILQLKDQTHTLNEVKKVQEDIVGGNITEEVGNKKIEDLINHLETPKKQTDTGLVQTAAASSQGSFGPTPIASNFPAESLVGGPVYSDNSLVGTVQAADSKSVIQNKLAEQLARAKVQTTGKAQEANGQYFYINDKGNVASVPLNRPIYQPVFTGDPVVDKLEKADMNASYTAKINDIQSLYRAGRYSLDEYKAKINELYAQKAASGGGGKAKKLKIPKLKMSKAKSIKMKPFKFTPVKINIGKISGGAKIKTVSIPKLRTSPLTLQKLNIKFKQNFPRLIGKGTNVSSRGGTRGSRRGR